MIALALIFLAQLDESGPVFFKRLGEQTFLIILLVTSNWIFGKVLMKVRTEHIGDLKQQIEELKQQIKNANEERDRIWNYFTSGRLAPPPPEVTKTLPEVETLHT